MSIESAPVAKYTLLNDHGEPQDGYYIEVQQWPTAERNFGAAVYVDEDGTKDELCFTLDCERNVLITHHARAPNHKFDVTPIVQEGEVIELKMDLGDNDTATFVLYPEDYETEEFDEELINFACFTSVAF